jgi:hypothetical protein
VLTGVLEPGDAAGAAANIAESEALFRAGLVAFGAIFVIDVLVAWALYILFRPVSNGLSLLAAWFRLVYTVFLGVVLISLFLAVRLVSDTDFLTANGAQHRDSHVLMMLDAFNYGWLIGLIPFGIHLALLGYVILRFGAGPRALGFLLVMAGAAYVFDTLAHALVANYDDYASVFLMIVALPAVVAELGFTVWLFTRGGKHQQISA